MIIANDLGVKCAKGRLQLVFVEIEFISVLHRTDDSGLFCTVGGKVVCIVRRKFTTWPGKHSKRERQVGCLVKAPVKQKVPNKTEVRSEKADAVHGFH
jgi:hypothetical protein